MEIDSRIFQDSRVGKTLIKFAIPTIISLLIMELYNMVDTIFVGIAIGPIGIGALTIAFPVQKIISSTGLMIAVGASTAVSRNLGEKNYEKVKKIILNAISLTTIILICMMFFIYFFKNPIIINFLGSSNTLFPYAEEYISIVIFGGIFQCLTLVIGYIIMALGDTKVTLKANSLGAFINIILDFILVVHFCMGVKGAAFATVISQIIAFLYALKKLIEVKNNIKLNFKFIFEMSVIKTIVSVGFSTFIVEVSDGFLAIILNNLLSSYGGDDAVVIIGTITKISMFLFITVLGISSAMQPIAAFNYGAKNYEKLKEIIKKTFIFITITTLAVWGIMFIFAYNLIGIFLKEEQILMLAVKAFRTVILIFPCVGVYYIAIYCCQAMGKAKSSFILSIYREIIVCIPVAIIFVSIFGTNGAWISYPIADGISALTGAFFIKKFLKEINKTKENNLSHK